jgi:hypothetical protein
MFYLNQQDKKKSVKITCFLTQKKKYFETENEKVYFFEPLEKEIFVDDMQKIADANNKLRR